jgi:hypothetical protein
MHFDWLSLTILAGSTLVLLLAAFELGVEVGRRRTLRRIRYIS